MLGIPSQTCRLSILKVPQFFTACLSSFAFKKYHGRLKESLIFELIIPYVTSLSHASSKSWPRNSPPIETGSAIDESVEVLFRFLQISFCNILPASVDSYSSFVVQG
jgi:hypothetical protein